MTGSRLVERAGNVSVMAADAELLDIEEQSTGELATALGVGEPDEWPPEHNGAGFRAWMRELFRENPDEPGYGTWYVIGGGRLCGTAGFKGPPRDGSVEIGYSIVAADRHKGFASGAVGLLTARAFRDPRVAAVKAETLPDLAASQAVLRKCGFGLIAIRSDPDDGEIWCYELRRP